MYLVMGLSESQTVRLQDGSTTELELTWADGMVGTLPVFDNREDAEEYANGLRIVEIEEDNK